ncbi:MAG: 16S rRNA (guanine(966)-N(2))-methyltransferase RsmD [Acidimicrobiia bacterium]
MRVVAGEARGRRLVAPPGTATRPTSDRVREAIFNALTSLDVLDGALVLDAFAGSGALGIEALSRGARHCVFVERDRSAAAVVRQNLEATGLADRAEVIVGDGDVAVGARAWDLVLLDPPYAFEAWMPLLDRVGDAHVVIESDREPELPAAWRIIRVKRYSGTVVMFARRADDPKVNQR